MAFGNPEIDLDRVDAFEIDQIFTAGHVIADTYPAQADDTRERRREPGLVQAGFGQRHFRAVAVEAGAAFIDGARRSGAASEQLLGPTEIAFAQSEVGLRVGEFGARNRIVEGEQQVAGVDGGAFVEMDIRYAGVDFGADHHELVRPHRPDRGNLAGHGTARRGLRFHGHGPRLRRRTSRGRGRRPGLPRLHARHTPNSRRPQQPRQRPRQAPAKILRRIETIISRCGAREQRATRPQERASGHFRYAPRRRRRQLSAVKRAYARRSV